MKQYLITLATDEKFICWEDELLQWKSLFNNNFRNRIIKIEELKEKKK